MHSKERDQICCDLVDPLRVQLVSNNFQIQFHQNQTVLVSDNYEWDEMVENPNLFMVYFVKWWEKNSSSDDYDKSPSD